MKASYPLPRWADLVLLPVVCLMVALLAAAAGGVQVSHLGRRKADRVAPAGCRIAARRSPDRRLADNLVVLRRWNWGRSLTLGGRHRRLCRRGGWQAEQRVDRVPGDVTSRDEWAEQVVIGVVDALVEGHRLPAKLELRLCRLLLGCVGLAGGVALRA